MRIFQFFLFVFLLYPFLRTNAQSDSVAFFNRQIEIISLLEKDDWAGLVALLENLRGKVPDSDQCRTAPELRLLYGHAALVSGKNNAAVSQFYCICDSATSSTLTRWESWTREALAKTNQSVAARYLHADALARLNKMQGSKTELDNALKTNQNHTPSLNARGVVGWILYKNGEAKYRFSCIKDWQKVEATVPQFADAWINHGVSRFLEGAPDTNIRKECFFPALRADPENCMALNGLTVSYFHERKEEKFAEYREKAICSPFAALNYGNATIDDISRGSLSASMKPVDFGIGFKYKDFEFNARGGVYTRLEEGLNKQIGGKHPTKQSGTWFALNYPAPKYEFDKKN